LKYDAAARGGDVKVAFELTVAPSSKVEENSAFLSKLRTTSLHLSQVLTHGHSTQ